MGEAAGETGWLPEVVYRAGRFESGVAMMVDAGGRIARFSRAPEDTRGARRLRRRAMLPGMVNGHSHTFQRLIRGRAERRSGAGRDTFWTWREAMYAAAARLGPEEVRAAAAMAFLEMLLAGVTAVGEFHYLHHQPDGTPYEERNLLARKVLEGAREAGLRVALLRTAYVRAGFGKAPNPGQARFLTPRVEDFVADTEALIREVEGDGMAWVGVAPHSVRAAPVEYLRDVAEYARGRGLALHMHAAEQPGEVEECVAEHGRRPVELLADAGVMEGKFTAVHAIHITGEEARLLGRAGATVCACPTTERNLGDGAVPADVLAAEGVRMSLGSDSNAQIDPLEDARELEYHLRMKRLERAVLAPDESAEGLARLLFDCASRHGAESLGAPSGSLEEGRPADFFTVDLDDPALNGAGEEALLSNVVFAGGRAAIREVAVGGRLVVEDGRHRDQEAIGRRFHEVQQALWRG